MPTARTRYAWVAWLRRCENSCSRCCTAAGSTAASAPPAASPILIHAIAVADRIKLAMPSASSRQASADDIDATSKARHEIEKNHVDIVQLSTEKVRLAHIAMEMIQFNIGALDKELNPFTQEMKERNEAGFEDEFAVDADTPAAGGALDPMTMAFMSGHDFDLGTHGNAPPMPAQAAQKKSHKKKVPLPPQPGERVAANIGEVSGDPGAQEWIVAVVVAHKPEEGAYEVMDADEESDDSYDDEIGRAHV